MKTDKVQSVRGYVQTLPGTPGREDAPGVAIIAGGGAEYHIARKGAGMDPADFISADGEVRGTAVPLPLENEDAPEEGETGKSRAFLLTARSCQLTDSFDDPWYHDA